MAAAGGGVSAGGQLLYLDPSLGRAGGHHAPLARGFADLLGGGIAFAGARGGMFSGIPAHATFLPRFDYRLEDAFRVSRYGAAWAGRGAIADAARALSFLWPGAGRALPRAPKAGHAMDGAAFKHLFQPLGAGRSLKSVLAEQTTWRAVICIGADPAMVSALHGERDFFTALGAPRLHLVFMYPEHEFLNARTEAPYFELIRDMMQWPHPPSLYTELDEHAGALQCRLGAPVLRQVLPYRVRAPRTAAAQDEFVVAVLGAGRADKAFDMLPEIVVATRALDPNVQFRIQRPGARARLGRYVNQLEREGSVALLPAVLGDDAYEAELARAHVVLLAYDPQRYARRGSGVLVDALVAGRPVVCVAGTALAGALGHGNGLAAEGAQGLSRALAEARGRYPDLLAGAARASAATVIAMVEGPLISALKSGNPSWA